MRATLVALLFVASCAAASRGQAPPDSTTAALADTASVPQRDIFDVIDSWRNRPTQREVEVKFGLDWSLLPTFSYNPVYGFAFGALLSGSGRLGPNTARYSQLAISGNYSTEGQIQAQFRGDVYGASGNTLAKIDFRYLDTNRSTWGLGPFDEAQEEYPMEFKLIRTYATLFRRTSGPVFIGLGYHYDEFADIVDERAEQGDTTTPFVTYSGGLPGKTTASGLSINLLADTRDNLVNALSGYYLSWSFRNYLEALGGDRNWQELWVEARVYPHVPRRSSNVLAFWLYGWMTFGAAPYLNLPSDGWDTYGRGARGYLQGRIRGANQIYFEAEYRFALTRDGLLGATAFVNMTATTDQDSQVFGRGDSAFGGGLRIKFSRESNTNLAIDYGWGRGPSKGLFLGMTEAF